MSCGWYDWWKELVMEIFRKSAIRQDLDSEVLSKIANQLIEDYKTEQCWEIYDNVGKLLKDIKKHQLVVGIISNFDPRINNVLESLKIEEVDLVVTSYQVGHQKPDPEIFNVALEKANELAKEKILPENCLHIGNHPIKDYQGARNANWKSALVSFEDHSNAHLYNPIFEDINQFYEHLNTRVIDW